MPDENMTLVERLRNPQWSHKPGDAPALDVEQTRKDMEEAAALIEGQARRL